MRVKHLAAGRLQGCVVQCSCDDFEILPPGALSCALTTKNINALMQRGAAVCSDNGWLQDASGMRGASSLVAAGEEAALPAVPYQLGYAPKDLGVDFQVGQVADEPSVLKHL